MHDYKWAAEAGKVDATYRVFMPAIALGMWMGGEPAKIRT